MKKTTGKVKIEDNRTRHFVRLVSDNCEHGTRECENELFLFLAAIANTRELTYCGYQPFDRMSIKHDGERWVAEAEAIEIKDLDPPVIHR